MHWVYTVKNDFTYKARLVCDGSQVDPRGLDTCATVIKSISVRLLDLIAHTWNKQIITGDISNAFVQFDTKEKIYTQLGSKFDTLTGLIEIIVQDMYGLTTSAKLF